MNKPRILVVEDENVVAADIQECVDELGYSVVGTAASALEALRTAVNTEPDLVLMDIKLRGPIDGVEAAEQLHDRLGIPVVYLTAYADTEILSRAKKTPPAGYVLKPFDGRALRSAIEIALHRHETEKQWANEERWLAAAIQSVEEAVIVTQRRGFVTFMNLAAEALTGWKKEEAAGKHIAEIFTAISRDGGSILKPVERVMIEDAAVRLGRNVILVGRDKSERQIRGNATPLRDEEGKLVGAALIFHEPGPPPVRRQFSRTASRQR